MPLVFLRFHLSQTAESTEQTAESTEQTADVQNTADQGEEKTITGTIDEIKDFMFIITDESGAAYEFSFETAPEGLENVAGGDTVKVTYTGEISEVDPFNGTVISVEKQ